MTTRSSDPLVNEEPPDVEPVCNVCGFPLNAMGICPRCWFDDLDQAADEDDTARWKGEL